MNLIWLKCFTDYGSQRSVHICGSRLAENVPVWQDPIMPVAARGLLFQPDFVICWYFTVSHFRRCLTNYADGFIYLFFFTVMFLEFTQKYGYSSSGNILIISGYGQVDGLSYFVVPWFDIKTSLMSPLFLIVWWISFSTRYIFWHQPSDRRLSSYVVYPEHFMC